MSQLIAVNGTTSMIDDVQTVAGLKTLLGDNLNSLALYGSANVLVFSTSGSGLNAAATQAYADTFNAAQAATVAAALAADPASAQQAVQTTLQIFGPAVITAASNFM